MASTTSRRARDKRSKLQRTELMTIRLDPELRFWVDLACSLQRRTASHFAEEAMRRAVWEVKARDNQTPLPKYARDFFWHPMEADRFVKVALRWPECLTYEQQAMWVFIPTTLTLGIFSATIESAISASV
jgi:hypothetical protein